MAGCDCGAGASVRTSDMPSTFVELRSGSSVWNPMRSLAAWSALVVLIAGAGREAHARPWVNPAEVGSAPDEPPTTAVVAQPPPEIDPPPVRHDEDRDRWRRWRLTGAIGVRFGSFRVNGASSGTAIPFHVDLGVRKDRLVLYASYDVLGIDLDVPDGAQVTARGATTVDLGDGSGLVQRVGANARYGFARAGEHDGGFELWAEGGIGVQHVRWDAGGVWTRPDIALGLGGTILGLGKHEHGGFSLGLRIMLAPRSDVADGAPAVCGGPCDRATAPAGWDRSFLFDMTVPFGR